MSIRNIRLNLLPPEYRPAPTVTVFPIFFGVIVGLVVLVVSIMFLLTQADLNEVSAKVERTTSEIVSLKPSVDSYDLIMSAVDGLRKRKDVFVYLDNSFTDWYLFIANIAPLVPENVWLFEISAETQRDALNAGRVSVRGRVAEGEVLPVSFFMENLEVSPYFTDVRFVDSILSYIVDKPVHEFTVEVEVKSPREFVREWKEPVAAENGNATNVDESAAAATPGET